MNETREHTGASSPKRMKLDLEAQPTNTIIDEKIHNYECFGNPLRKIGKSWSQISCTDKQDQRDEWFKANRMSSLNPGSWEIEQKFEEEWLIPCFHQLDNDYFGEQTSSNQPSASNSSQGSPNPSVDSDQSKGQNCLECMKALSFDSPLQLAFLYNLDHIVAYLAVSVYRGTWKMDAAKAVYSAARLYWKTGRIFSLYLCLEHLEATKLLMELSHLVSRKQRSPLLARFTAIARVFQESVGIPLSSRMELEQFIGNCYEPLLSNTLRPQLFSSAVNSFLKEQK